MGGHIFRSALILAGFFTGELCAGDAIPAEDFETGFSAKRWNFSAGQEFPGASGNFEKTKDAAHAGQGGGQLSFDFTGGGNYVAAILHLDQAPELAAVTLWVFRSGDQGLTFRYCDQTGQVHQKPFFAPKGRWSEITIDMDDWQLHYAGANNGRLNGGPQWIAFLVENTGARKGQLWIDEIRLTPGRAAPTTSATYAAFRFTASERWPLFSPAGNGGASRLDAGKLTCDFTRGARTLIFSAPDESLLGSPVELSLRLRGQAPGHELRLQLATHWMIFERSLGAITNPAEHEIVVPVPPGKGWRFYGGENDGVLHGPLRVAGLVVEAGANADRVELDLLEIKVTSEHPANRACVLLADYHAQEGTFEAVARSLLPKPVEGSLAWTIRNWDGAILSQGAKTVTLPAMAEPLIVDVNAPAGNQQFAEAEFTLRVEGQKISPVTAYRVAPVHHNGDNRQHPSSPFGMGVYLYRHANNAEGLTDMDREAELAARAGVKWSREEFTWGRIERQKGDYDWSFYDQLVATAKKHGIAVYGLLAYWADWTKPYTQEGIADYCRFAAAAADRYRNDIQHWEVWNEPNIFFWQGPREMYADLLKQAYAALKQANPKASVLGCSTAGIDIDFIKKTIARGAPFDILTIHPYRKELNDHILIEEVRQAADLAKRDNGTMRPVWITEMGWTTSTRFPWMGQDFEPTSQRRQAEWMIRSYLDALASGVSSNISWYDFRNDGEDPFNAEFNMGILARDYRAKPAYRAFATMTHLLAGKRFDRLVDAGKNVMAIQFTGGNGGPVIALWSPEDELDVQFPLAKPVSRVNLMGETQPLEIRDGRGRIRAPAGQPVFVTER